MALMPGVTIVLDCCIPVHGARCGICWKGECTNEGPRNPDEIGQGLSGRDSRKIQEIVAISEMDLCTEDT